MKKLHISSTVDNPRRYVNGAMGPSHGFQIRNLILGEHLVGINYRYVSVNSRSVEPDGVFLNVILHTDWTPTLAAEGSHGVFRTLVRLKCFFTLEFQLGDRNGEEGAVFSADGLPAHGTVAPKPLVCPAGDAVLDSLAETRPWDDLRCRGVHSETAPRRLHALALVSLDWRGEGTAVTTASRSPARSFKSLNNS